jgi:hypothetical protein
MNLKDQPEPEFIAEFPDDQDIVRKSIPWTFSITASIISHPDLRWI